MSVLGFVRLVVFVSNQIKLFFLNLKKKEIIDAKNDALESGDQRVFESAISDDNNTSDNIDLPSGKYSGMYERAAKKKS